MDPRGDFNSVTSDREKLGGAPVIPSSCSSFNACIDDCSLIDLGYLGPPFTWSRGELRERLDEVMSNSAWLSMYPSCYITHLPIPSSNHCGLWIRMDPDNIVIHNYFKFLGAWLDHPDFSNQISFSWIPSSSWNQNIERTSNNLRI